MIHENDDYVNKTQIVRPSGLSKWLPTIVLSSALIGFISLAWYAYHAGRQSVKEEDLLVVEAEKTPVKEKPLDPGGMKFPNQDKTIFETFGSNNNQAPKVERVLPAPEEPIAQNESQPEIIMADNSDSAKTAGNIEQKISDHIIYREDEAADKQAEQEKPVEVKKVEAVGVDDKKSDTHKAAATKAIELKPAESKAVESKPAKTGGVKVQLGAYSSDKEARETWAKIQKKFSELSSKSPIIVHANVKGKSFYRLRVGGFASVDQAKKLCSSLSAKGQACLLPKD
jgi:cell division septation protein DedD